MADWVAGSPAAIDLEQRITSRHDYNGFTGIRLESAYPILQGYKDEGALGYHVDFSDPMSVNRFGLTASYTPGDDLPASERPHLQLQYRRYNWRAFYQLNGADFYDLFGPT
jgi:hypothetical protein